MMIFFLVEDHFAKALGDTWLKIKAAKAAKDGGETNASSKDRQDRSEATPSPSGGDKSEAPKPALVAASQ